MTVRRAAAALPLALVAPAVAVGMLAATGALAAQQVPGLPDPGSLTRVGLPLAQAVRDVAAILTVGMLVLVATCLPADDPDQPQLVRGERRRVVELVVAAASCWMWASVALLVLSFSDAAGVSVGDPAFGEQLAFFALEIEAGRYLLFTAALAAIVAMTALLGRTVAAVGWATVVALAGLWPMALAGHAAGSTNHSEAVDLQALHWIGLSVWAGGLAGLLVVSRHLGDSLVDAVRRYSRLAGWSLAAVAVSGVLGALLRTPGLEALNSTYGVLLGVKVTAIAALAVAGVWQRHVGIAQLEGGKRAGFVRVVMVEVIVLAAAAGTGVALSRTEPPGAAAEEPLSVNEALLGYPMPSALGAGEWFTQWRPDTFWLPVAILATVAYLAAAGRLRGRGDRWSRARSSAWVGGWALLVWATSGAPGVYGQVLFSMHMVQHMTVALAVPTFLVLGAPVTLALRALPKRADGSRGAREWLLAVVHSWPARLLGSPIVASALVVVSLVTFYYSSLFELSLRTHTGHLLMTVHFLLTGYLFANVLIGIDPGPRRPPYPLRVLIILVTFGFHALFSVSLMASNTVLARSWYSVLDRPWGASLADDQYLGASLGWALGDYPLAILAGALIASWVAADRRERRRLDRKADRDGDRDRREYNDYLARLSSGGTGARVDESP